MTPFSLSILLWKVCLSNTRHSGPHGTGFLLVPVTGTLTQDSILDGALGIVQVDEELPIQVLDVALAVRLPVTAPDTLQPAGQGRGCRQPHFLGHIIQTFDELCREGSVGCGPRCLRRALPPGRPHPAPRAHGQVPGWLREPAWGGGWALWTRLRGGWALPALSEPGPNSSAPVPSPAQWPRLSP